MQSLRTFIVYKKHKLTTSTGSSDTKNNEKKQ